MLQNIVSRNGYYKSKVAYFLLPNFIRHYMFFYVTTFFNGKVTTLLCIEQIKSPEFFLG